MFQVRGPGSVIETVVCLPHDNELKSTTGWVFDYELRRIRVGADAPATPTGYRVGEFQDDGRTFTILFTRGEEEGEIALRLSDVARARLVQALGGVMPPSTDS